MTWFWMALASFIPGLLWVWYFYRQDRQSPEPQGLVLRAFLYGILATFPAAFLELTFRDLIQNPPSLLGLLFWTTFGIGLIEEVAKFLAVYLAVGKEREFDQVIDGIVYAVAAALGFAALETFFYTGIYGWRAVPVRAVLTSLVHASFSGIVGYHLGLAKVRQHSYPRELWKGLSVAVVLHGLYDWLVLGGLASSYIILLFFLLIYAELWRKIRQAQKDDDLV